jgi:WD repeat-containing protein 44
MNRTNTPFSPTANQRPQSAESATNGGARPSIDASTAPAVQSPIKRTDTIESTASVAPKDLRKGVKAVSFISRLMGNKRKDDEQAIRDDESVSNEGRPEGNDAEVFALPVDNITYSPSQPQPPAYIKMRSKYKKEREFDRVFLAQELECRKRRKVERQNSSNKLRRKSSAPNDANTVWAMEFSRDGKYLAAAGVDGIVKVWAVLSSSDDRQKHEKQEAAQNEENGVGAHAEHLSAPVFQSQPVREYEGHTSTVLDLSWSKNNFLLSSSMDKTVRLWHVSRAECLCTFKHNDFVPSIAFHPKDDRFFLAGSLDARLRLWSIPDKSVAYTAHLPDMITAVTFTPDGKYAMAGCLSGLCMFYETEGMKYQSQVHVRSSRGQNAKGSKITGIQAFNDSRGDIKLLITSNDSRIRIYNLRDKSLELKFRGNENNCSQIRATLSDDGRYVVCGSEDRKAYIWSMGPAEGEKRDRRPMEMFEANDTLTTVVCYAPAKTRHLLSKSEDPIYDLCNPPPVTLMSRAERAESQSSSRPPTDHGSIQATPAEMEGEFKRPKESPTYLARSSHKNGNIIVTADFTGKIKVFRQDCAWQKRKLGDDSDKVSIFSKRNGKLSRTGSVMTRGSQPSLREGRTSTSLSGPSDRILSWRQGIASTPSIARRDSSKNNSRSISPHMSVDVKASSVPKTDPSGSRWTGWATTTQTQSRKSVTIDTKAARAAAFGPMNTNGRGSGSNSPRSIKEENPLNIQGGRSYVFWDTDEWKARAERQHRMHEVAEQYPISPDEGIDALDEAGAQAGAQDGTGHLAVRPPLDRGRTAVSELSDERSSLSEYEDAPEDREMKCKKCGGRNFTAKRLKDGSVCMVCTICSSRV